jgi:hypothetical protein
LASGQCSSNNPGLPNSVFTRQIPNPFYYLSFDETEKKHGKREEGRRLQAEEEKFMIATEQRKNQGNR